MAGLFMVLALALTRRAAAQKRSGALAMFGLLVVEADKVPPRTIASNYPEPYASWMAGRIKRPLGDYFGLSNFGVNLTTIEPGGRSALRHAHSRQDEFVLVIEGRAVLITDAGETEVLPGMCAGFKAGQANAHHLVNKSQQRLTYLEVGDRSRGDEVSYPDDDLVAVKGSNGWQFQHKDGCIYPGQPTDD